MKRSFVIAPPETGQERSSTTFLSSPLRCPIASVNQTNLPFEEGKGEEPHLPYLSLSPEKGDDDDAFPGQQFFPGHDAIMFIYGAVAAAYVCKMCLSVFTQLHRKSSFARRQVSWFVICRCSHFMINDLKEGARDWMGSDDDSRSSRLLFIVERTADLFRT